jgi:hypothetical protein
VAYIVRSYPQSSLVARFIPSRPHFIVTLP